MLRFLRSTLLLAALAALAIPVAGQSAGSPGQRGSRLPPVDLESAEAQVFLQALSTISHFHSSALADSTLWDRALEGLLEQLDDPYATVYTPAEYDRFRETNTGDYAGIGVQITMMDSRVTVTAVFRDTPAEGVGMLVGDRIVWVEGIDAREWTLDQARDSIRGEPGSVVRIRVARDGFSEPIPFSIVRDNVHVEAVAATWVEDGIAYFGIDRIARGVSEELRQALEEYEGAKALIVDLRGNPGGYLDESLQIADMLLAPGEKLASVDSRGVAGAVSNQEWTARSPARIAETPIVILVDAYTASAAEIISGALQDNDRAVVVGRRTFGKGAVQTHYPLPAGRQISITTGSWYTPLGRSLNRARHRDGSLKPEDASLPDPVVTAAGRELPTGGGIIPDLEVESRVLEQERRLVNNASEAQVPFGTLIRDHAFDLAKQALAAGEIEVLPSSAFDGLAAELVEAGMDPEIVEDPVARAYLDRQTQLHYLYRANAPALRLLVQAERDEALAEALRLARSARTPAELFTLVDETRENAPSAR
ncbi:MAG: PDZ domain-containing protein [Gemmatimonadetes bacterium]|nr:PDZ domain-containing protein [Gemmatimonadota bacterium]MYB07609.1 PDZ domain-containing protein [Gemmatimonadota bacterium]MYE17299.1 PDZ domain-containing protein [Gemmatimonadota bacterium]MYG23095.1 PDZ domain-containing protein [Gemmatimonadota bacterium]MYJ38533.1 PDZ domain-containing protein [Gemmatimonadota bacterium]